MSEFKVGDYVVYKNISHEHGIFPDGLFVVTHKTNWKYLTIKETKCWHHNKKKYGSYGDDVRHAKLKEVEAGRRLP